MTSSRLGGICWILGCAEFCAIARELVGILALSPTGVAIAYLPSFLRSSSVAGPKPATNMLPGWGRSPVFAKLIP